MLIFNIDKACESFWHSWLDILGIVKSILTHNAADKDIDKSKKEE